MAREEDRFRTSRRTFLQALAALGVSGAALLRPRTASAASLNDADALPPMTTRTLGRTGYQASRLVFGCGAALARKPDDALLEAALAAGVNVFDVGFSQYYRDAEKNLGPFARRHRDRIFLISKAIVPIEVEPDQEVSLAQARAAADDWLALMDESLRQLGVDHVDAYYLMASNNPSLVGSDEIHRAFEKAKQAGKMDHLGLSTHQNAAKVLETATQTGAFSLAMIAITPGGWYDWEDKGLLANSPSLKELQPLLAKARDAGVGLVGMKAGRYLAGRKFIGWGKSDAFDEFYDEKLLRSGLSAFQRSYAFVLEHGLDVVNADMQSFAHFRENFVAAATAPEYFA
jgi:hypothetical protein